MNGNGNGKDPFEPVLMLLTGMMIFFTFVLIFCEWKFTNDGQVFQVISNLLASLGGAFFMRIKPRGADTNGNGNGNGTAVTPAAP